MKTLLILLSLISTTAFASTDYKAAVEALCEAGGIEAAVRQHKVQKALGQPQQGPGPFAYESNNRELAENLNSKLLLSNAIELNDVPFFNGNHFTTLVSVNTGEEVSVETYYFEVVRSEGLLTCKIYNSLM